MLAAFSQTLVEPVDEGRHRLQPLRDHAQAVFAEVLGLEGWGEIEIDLEHPSLLGVDPADVFPALVFGCSADVLA